MYENSKPFRENRFQHEFAVNVWLGIGNELSSESSIFLPDKLNAARYTEFLETDFFDYLEDIHLQIEMWFQLDGCQAHYGRFELG